MEPCRPRLTRSQSQALTRERLIETARALFARDGFVTTSVEKIAETAGYSKGAVYSNFGDKEEIFLAALHAEGDAHMASLLAALSEAGDAATAVDVLAHWADARAASGNWALTIMEHARAAPADSASMREQERILRAFWRQLGEVLLVRFPDAGTDAQTLGALMFELAYAPALGRAGMPTPGTLVRLVLGLMG